MAYSSKCSVCTHRHADRINDMLRRRALGESDITFRRVMGVVSDLGGPDVTECALSRHASKHFDINAEGARRAAEQYANAADQVAAQKLTDVEVLDKLIARGLVLMDSGDIQPDTKDIIAAVKVKNATILKDENPIEALFAMVADSMGGGEE